MLWEKCHKKVSVYIMGLLVYQLEWHSELIECYIVGYLEELHLLQWRKKIVILAK